MFKKWFDWTPRDVAYWENLRQKGLRRFILWNGIVITGGLLFLVFGIITTIIWFRQTSAFLLTPLSWAFLAGQLIFVALVCLVFGIINSLITWTVEERLYRKYKTMGQTKDP
jgi:hypothetical protein